MLRRCLRINNYRLFLLRGVFNLHISKNFASYRKGRQTNPGVARMNLEILAPKVFDQDLLAQLGLVLVLICCRHYTGRNRVFAFQSLVKLHLLLCFCTS